jgi:hypothetical protein
LAAVRSPPQETALNEQRHRQLAHPQSPGRDPSQVQTQTPNHERHTMTTIEHSTPREIRQSIREKFAQMPTNVDHNGFSVVDRATTDAMANRSVDPVGNPVTEPESPQVDSTPTSPRPDPSQGWQGLPAPRPLTPAERIRRQLTKHDN